MGDITGRPKAPAQQVVYVPQYVYPTTTPDNSGTNNNNTNGEDVLTPEKQREKNLLSRARSKIGTVLTGFRGILEPIETQSGNQRKTLLGE